MANIEIKTSNKKIENAWKQTIEKSVDEFEEMSQRDLASTCVADQIYVYALTFAANEILEREFGKERAQAIWREIALKTRDSVDEIQVCDKKLN